MLTSQINKPGLFKILGWMAIFYAVCIGGPAWIAHSMYGEEEQDVRLARLTGEIEVFHKNINQCREYCKKDPLLQKTIPTRLPEVEKMHQEYKEHLGICVRICTPGAAPAPQAPANKTGTTGQNAFLGAAAGVAASELFRQAVK